ncbi:hypothetical protein EVAR_59645_1 [Eumeta japonica]|uniref:Uncharacterized protein n=1 Tax=Eumeta variegata TaxID=151549 RepID=A0A4C1YI65_EUMVA|nr:hypothetical protein EVAR_59645_1 [Eumeta japonica]
MYGGNKRGYGGCLDTPDNMMMFSYKTLRDNSWSVWRIYASIVLETCSNVMELSELINENDFDDEPPTLTPLPSPVLPLVFNSETRSDAEPQLVHRND